MENIKTCELCLKQIIKTEDFENFNCDEKQNLQILQNLKITVGRDAKICSDCVNISHLTYNFKTYCLTNNDHLKTLIRPSINDKLILEEVVVGKSKSEVKNEKVCRFCLNFFELNSLVEINLEQDVVLKDMLGRCLPEIDTKFVQNPLMCFICNKLLKKLYNFISRCKDTEVFRNLDPKTDIIVNENESTLTVENSDIHINESFVKEENCDGIENTELQIKSEDFDIKEDSIKKSNPVDEKDVKPSPHGTIKKKKFICDICSYQTTKNECLKQHYVIHKEPSEVNLFKCDYCPFVTKWRTSLTSHKIFHNAVNSFKCDYCPFVTKWKYNLTTHTMRHTNPSELPKFKCNDCSYETSHKTNLLRHVFVHKNPSQVNMYKCKVCPYQTKIRDYFQKHQKRHQAEVYTCDECNYKVKTRKSFILHLGDHKEGKQPVKTHTTKLSEDFTVKLPDGTIKEKKFVCDICSYQTTKNYHLQQHYLIHKEPSEVNLFKCDYCPFATKWKYCLTVHTVRHKNPSELPKFICNNCTYETYKKKNLISHVLVHKNPSQGNMYKCKVCPFQTKGRCYLQKHQKRHQKHHEIYTCDKCNYKSKLKHCLMRHIQYHRVEATSEK